MADVGRAGGLPELEFSETLRNHVWSILRQMPLRVFDRQIKGLDFANASTKRQRCAPNLLPRQTQPILDGLLDTSKCCFQAFGTKRFRFVDLVPPGRQAQTMKVEGSPPPHRSETVVWALSFRICLRKHYA